MRPTKRVEVVLVIQQALQRQPGTAAQYLQQMYAAQQQHLMLQTAALQQQQQLSSAQLHSLAAVQQVSSCAALRCALLLRFARSAHLWKRRCKKTEMHWDMNLATSPAAAQLISRAQGVSSAPASITQQAVLLGNASGPALAASQAQMYLRAQMLILTPAATVAAVHPEPPAQSSSQPQSAAQGQNLAMRSQQGAVPASPSQVQLQALGLKHASLAGLPTTQCPGGKGSFPESSAEGVGKAEGAIELASHAPAASGSVTAGGSRPLLAPAYAQIQTQQPQFVMQQQQARTMPALTLQPAVTSPPPGQLGPVPVLPRPPAPAPQQTIFHSAVGPHVLGQIGQPQLLKPVCPPKAHPVQLAAINLQIQPAPAPAALLTQDGANREEPTALVVRECSPMPGVQPTALPPLPASATEQHKPDSNKPAAQAQGVAERGNAGPGASSPPAMTSGSGSSAPPVTGSAPHNADNKPPQAVVKPQILTHVIEGFVIQEGAQPFPVERPSLLMENLTKQKPHLLQSDAENGKPTGAPDCDMENLQQGRYLKEREDEPTLTCELCGLVDFAYKFKRSKRFCSTLCAKRYNVGCTKRMGLFHPNKNKPEKHKKRRPRSSNGQSGEDRKQVVPAAPQASAVGSMTPCVPARRRRGGSSPGSDASSYEEPPSPLSAARGRTQEQHFLPSDPTQWSVQEVFSFICSLPGCQEIAEEFRSQEIDGQALLLLKEDHLMSTMNIKLGPALKLYAHISLLKDS
ncbi:polyhomeotic-like protein 2 isoform X2 [Arapaima gigas]